MVPSVSIIAEDVQVQVRRNALSRKIRWACDLHATEMGDSAHERPRALPKVMKRAGELFSASALYVAMFVMWVAVALRLF